MKWIFIHLLIWFLVFPAQAMTLQDSDTICGEQLSTIGDFFRQGSDRVFSGEERRLIISLPDWIETSEYRCQLAKEFLLLFRFVKAIAFESISENELSSSPESQDGCLFSVGLAEKDGQVLTGVTTWCSWYDEGKAVFVGGDPVSVNAELYWILFSGK